MNYNELPEATRTFDKISQGRSLLNERSIDLFNQIKISKIDHQIESGPLVKKF